jgi:putative hydrolase of the HAD superfamily
MLRLNIEPEEALLLRLNLSYFVMGKNQVKQQTIHSILSIKKAVIFDLFHTLTSLESTGSIGPGTSQLLGVSREEWNEQLMEKSRERLTGEARDAVSIIRNMAHAIDPSISEDVIEKATMNRIERFRSALITIPETTIDVLRMLKERKHKLGLISNADVSEVIAWRDSPISHLFDSVIFSCEVGFVKPEREIYEISMKQLRVEAHECLFIGDGGSMELKGAQDVGMSTILMTGIIKEIWPSRIDERKQYADLVMENLVELLAE